ncbi:hypothetical protein BCR32DRAFT_272871 [Anaeromyces robustus]|uniref:DUF6935 domain-containing protein n=1 Tax=Anaeromyces robustus TaxID=1754192 RepID=A0A1Y1VUR7_9FUNG|nr:hypothetical protein BCR32DRAFT_272871 [Anaeromyces robustus]|eukprot:ORX65031.1 hypothetical protein BCR32DRAFT_272871 [Anaeromyces robustus]
MSMITNDIKYLVTPTVSNEWESRYDTKLENGKEKITEEKIQKFIVRWTMRNTEGEYYLPNTAEQLSWIDRSDDNTGRFLVAALFFCTLITYTPSNEKNFDEMMKVLVDSPTAKKYNKNYSPFSSQNFKLNLRKRNDGIEKYKYLGKAYFKGASPKNQYTPEYPPSVVLEDDKHQEKSNSYGGTELIIYKVKINFAGADSERRLSVYKDKEDGQWYIYGDSFMGFVVDIKRPCISFEEALPFFKKVVYTYNEQPIVNLTEIRRRNTQDSNNYYNDFEKPLMQAQVIFTNINNENIFPDTADKLAKIDRSGPYGDLRNDKGRFITVAAYFAALKTWTPEKANEVNKMMTLLCESPTSKVLDRQVFNAFDKSFMKDNLSKSLIKNTPKYKYLGNSYFDGATPYNEYQPRMSLSVTLEDYVYDGVWSNDYQTTIYRIVSRFEGADNARSISVYQDPFDCQWYIHGDSYKAFISDVKNPILSEQSVVEMYKKKYNCYAKEISYNGADQPSINVQEVDRQYSQKDNEGRIMNYPVKIPQAYVTFNNNGKEVLPQNLNDLKKIYRGGDYELAKTGIIKNDKFNNLGRFTTVATYIAALKKINKNNPKEAYDMIEYLCTSPTSCALGSSVFNNHSQKFIKDNVIDKEIIPNHPKYEYLGNSYFNGANRYNNYTPKLPLTVIIEDYVYDGNWSDNYNTYIYTMVLRFYGSDTPRHINIYQDQYDHQWYIFSDSWKSLCVDIKKPMIQPTTPPKYSYYSYNPMDQPIINSEEVDGRYVVYNEKTGEEEIKYGKFVQKRISFPNNLPYNASDLYKISRQGPPVIKDNQYRNVSNLDMDNGRFLVAALYVATLNAWTPNTANEVDAMMKILCESPTSQALGSEIYNNHSSQAMRMSMNQNEKYKYLGPSYMEGATPCNGYKMIEPKTIIVKDYVYDGSWSDNYESKIYTMVVQSGGADTPRLLKVYQDPFDFEWYIFSDSWKSLMLDIRKPMLNLPINPRNDYNINEQPNIISEEIDGKYVVYNERTGQNEIRNGKFIQKRITFQNKLPSRASEIFKISRQGPPVQKDNQNRNISNLDMDNGRFLVAALYIATLKAWTPNTASEVDAMMKILCESPTSKALGTEVYNNHGKQAMKISMQQNQKYEYLGSSYLDGTSPENNYKTNGTTITIKDYAYDGIWSNNYESKIYTVVVQSSGADNPRLLKVYQDPFDYEWYIFSDSWKSLILDIRKPQN